MRVRVRGASGKRVRDRIARVTLVALVGAGCARPQGALRSGPYGPHPAPIGSTPTIGTDLRAVPPGRTVPPAGLGVDLVKNPPGPRRDAGVVAASSLVPAQ
jgi:hypothetical protein